MVDVHVPDTIYEVPVDIAFDYLNDYNSFKEFMFGVNHLEPISENTSGLGATFEGGMMLGPAHLKSTVKVIDWKQNELISMESIAGFDCTLQFSFAPLGESRSKVSSEVSYRLPGGIAGKLLGKTIQPFVAIATKHSVDNAAKHVPAYYARHRNSA